MPSPAPSEILAARKAAGLTQTQAATLVGVTLRAWQSWEAGQREMPARAGELFQIKTSSKNSDITWHDTSDITWHDTR